MPSSSVVSIELSEAEREQLESWSRRLTTAQALAQRSRIVLLLADGLRSAEIAWTSPGSVDTGLLGGLGR